MKILIHKAGDRGRADHGWLNAHHSFSFASWYNPARTHFGLLRVLNDDVVAPGMGFGEHPHDNMEIVTIPLKGSLRHRDSMGNSEAIRYGEVQLMSAGTGVRHSEFNDSKLDPVNLLQIWVFPKVRNIEPRYEQKAFDKSDRENKFQLIVSPDNENDSLKINQDAWFSMALIAKGETLQYASRLAGNGSYIFLISGEIEVDGNKLEQRDAIGIRDFDKADIKAIEESEILVLDIPMN
jgi:redox-sensitive bicupin YhaK (pirin superfamily)